MPSPAERFVAVLIERYDVDASHARFVVTDELRRGRVVEHDERLLLQPERFPSGSLEALRDLDRELVLDASRPALARNGSTPLGWGASRVAELPRPPEPKSSRRPALAGAKQPRR